ncbi:hypothetical protein PG993_000142 [Apiospora rasikravindrae]|uniref:Uncharacterized protein n=1 Tax=Apiospora rasikravindrae TaxID=990691 RepID=A0ABR1U7P3_9PEZI
MTAISKDATQTCTGVYTETNIEEGNGERNDSSRDNKMILKIQHRRYQEKPGHRPRRGSVDDAQVRFVRLPLPPSNIENTSNKTNKTSSSALKTRTPTPPAQLVASKVPRPPRAAAIPLR